jgi:Zn-dependent protease with chaperone function
MARQFVVAGSLGGFGLNETGVLQDVALGAAFNEAGTTAYTLTAAQGSFTLTGQAATLSRTRALAASQGSFALTGQAATLKRALNVAAAQGSFPFTGQAVNFNLGHAVVAGQGSFTLSGQTATFRRTL